MLKEVTVKIRLERIDIQEGMMVEALLDSRATELVISSEFARKQVFKLKKIGRPIYIRNMNGTLNKEKLIEYTVEVNIYYQKHRKRTEIDTIEGQKQSVILGMPWLAHYNTEIDWKIGEVKMTRCLEEYRKQQRPKQRKSEQKKQKKEEKKEEEEEKKEQKRKEKEKSRKERTIEVKRQQKNGKSKMKKKRQ